MGTVYNKNGGGGKVDAELLANVTNNSSSSYTFTYTGSDKAKLTANNFKVDITKIQLGWAGNQNQQSSIYATGNLITYNATTGVVTVKCTWSTYVSGSANFGDATIKSFKLYVIH
jgi:hypothetical protein